MANLSTKYNGTLNKLIEYYFKGKSNFFLHEEEIQQLSWKTQAEFIKLTVNSELLKKYPMNVNFSRLFMKKLLSFLEPTQEIHDEFYEYLCTVMKEQLDEEKAYYRHYIIGNDIGNIVTIKETNKMVINGTTGLKTWEAALMLSDWALSNKDIFENRKVLELGSGTGFTGITIAKYCYTKNIILSDCHPNVLNTIRDNIKINFPNINEEESQEVCMFIDGKTNLGVLMLDWNYSNDWVEDNLVPDVLIGADIIYDPSILEPLCSVIKTFCKRNSNLETYITNIIRNEETYRKFLQTLDSNGLKHEEIMIMKCNFIEYDTNIEKCFLKITNK